MQTNKNEIIYFLFFTTAIIILLATLIITLIYLYQKKQLAYHESLDKLKLDHEKNILKTQVEIQENTFENISREIHDNINLSLTLAKLNLNTINWTDKEKTEILIHSSVDLLSEAINDLSDISKSMNPEIVSNQGLINAIEREIERIERTGHFKINFAVTGNPIYMDAQKELVVFRIVQESMNNIIKHAKATVIGIELFFNNDRLRLTVIDNGSGFCMESFDNNPERKQKAGLTNMRTRALMFNGDLTIKSNPGAGTNIFVTIPY
jgi:two-component system, NarL family, sensor kinase